MITRINGHHIELVEVDTFGYEIYIDHSENSINPCDAAYFDKEPTWREIADWLNPVLIA